MRNLNLDFFQQFLLCFPIVCCLTAEVVEKALKPNAHKSTLLAKQWLKLYAIRQKVDILELQKLYRTFKLL